MGDNVSFRREAFDPKLAVLAQFFANLGNSQRADQAARSKQQADEEERKRQETQAMVEFLVKNGMFDQADQLSRESGGMMPPGGWVGVGSELEQRKQREAAAAAEAERAKGEGEMADLTQLMRLPQSGGMLNEGTTQEPMPGMTGLPGAQGTWQTEREAFPGSQGLTDQEAEVLAAIKHKLTPEQLKSWQRADMAPKDAVKGIRMDMGFEQTADQAADTAVASRNAAVGEKRLGLDERKFSYDQKQDIKKEAADLKKEAAVSGLPAEEYKNLSGLLDDVRTAVKPQVDALAAGRMMSGALDSGNSEVAQAAMVVFMKALDDSVAREGEVAEMVNKMGGTVNVRNKMSSFVRGKADPTFNEKMKNLIALVNSKNEALIDERLAGFDVQAEAAGPGAMSYYQRYRNTIKGGGAPPPAKPKGAGARANIVPASDLP